MKSDPNERELTGEERDAFYRALAHSSKPVVLPMGSIPASNHMTRDQANGAKYAAALRAIIERADTDKPGTSKVQECGGWR